MAELDAVALTQDAVEQYEEGNQGEADHSSGYPAEYRTHYKKKYPADRTGRGSPGHADERQCRYIGGCPETAGPFHELSGVRAGYCAHQTRNDSCKREESEENRPRASRLFEEYAQSDTERRDRSDECTENRIGSFCGDGALHRFGGESLAVVEVEAAFGGQFGGS